MDSAIRILHLEDDPADAELIAATLAAEGLVCECSRVSSRDEFVAALDGAWDLIIGDYAIPGFDGVTAQQLAAARRPDLPFVFVSGTMGEEVAVERLKAGATDYVLKQRLARLPSAVRRALQEADVRRERRALEEAVEFLQHLIAASPSIIFRLEPQTLRATFVSPNIRWLLGYEPEEVIGVPGFWQEIIHPEHRSAVVTRLHEGIGASVAQVEQEYRLRAKDGRYRWFFNLLRIDYDAEANPVGVLGYALDIAARKAAEEDLQRANAFLDSVVENLPVMLFVKEAVEGRFVRFNRAGEEMLGLPRSALLGRTDAEIFPPQLASAFATADREVLSSRTPVEIPEEIVATSGRGPRVLHTRKIPICDASGGPQYVLGISEDITERRFAQEAARLARLEAERASHAKSEFLSRMSHDLRTPLNAILGFAQLLEMDRLAPEQNESVRQILKGGAHLLELINEVLDIARIEAGHLSLSPEPVAVSEVVTQVVELIRPLGAVRGIAVGSDLPSTSPRHVRADRQRLTQILMNLVGNAVKYNRDAGTVMVSCTQQPDRLRIAVRDTGRGIPPPQLSLLFQPFERLGAEQSAVEGTGLGLAVSKGLVEAMDGAIGVESCVGEGSTFWIELPAVEAPAPTVEAPTPLAPAARATTGVVLYVEDNPSNVRLLERLLGRRAGISLITATTGAAALDTARRRIPDLILLDLHLPDSSGEDVLQQLWANPVTRQIPVAILSADATHSQIQRLLAAGAVAYLTKPLQLTRLLELLDSKLPAAGVRETPRE